MAFENRDLTVIAYANGFTLWYFRSTKDTLATIEKDNYFKPIYHLCNSGDIIIINPADGGAAYRVIEMEEKVVKLTKLKD